MSTVVGIDPSLTSTGIAVIRDGDPCNLCSFGHDGDDAPTWVKRSRRVKSQVIEITRRTLSHEPALIVIEGPLLQGPLTGLAFDRYALFLSLVDQFDVARLPFAVVHLATRATWATGKGESKAKRDVFAAIKREWPAWVTRHVTNDDIGDALVLAAMGSAHLGDTLPIDVPDWRRNNLANVKWPDLPKVAV
jgi:Holliday junction resolvasome RuvABC endonuclease subunit